MSNVPSTLQIETHAHIKDENKQIGIEELLVNVSKWKRRQN